MLQGLSGSPGPIGPKGAMGLGYQGEKGPQVIIVIVIPGYSVLGSIINHTILVILPIVRNLQFMYLNSVSIVFSLNVFKHRSSRYSNCHEPVAYIVASVSLSVISQRPIYRRSFSKISPARWFLRLLRIIAPVLNIDFIHAILEVINYLVY